MESIIRRRKRCDLVCGMVDVLEPEDDGHGGRGDHRDLRHDGVNQARRRDIVVLKIIVENDNTP